mmetsp:Transcript_16782/g.28776  ORF Transcript_16782/g.28776 Transcript_16782/m.28776 type:complete len:86 (-) Transcript_16782:482-739(-)
MLDHLFRPMDFQGQKLAELLMVRLLVIAAAISWIVGFLCKDFKLMVQICGAALALTSLVVLPAWPFYSRNPLNWLPNLDVADQKK